jgi:type VI secretion system protein ImpG
VRPVPSLTVVELELDAELGKAATGYRVPRGAELRSRPVQGMACRFRTCYDTTLWPVSVAAVEFTSPDRAGPGVRLANAAGAVRVELRAFPGVRLADLTLDELRLHLAGDPGVVDALYELLANNTGAVLVRDPDQPTRAARQLAAAAVRPAGFGPDDGLLPLPRRVPAAHRLLQELFILPQKFHFVDVAGVGDALRALGCGGPARSCSSSSRRSSVRSAGRRSSWGSPRVGAARVHAAVNLFAQTAEPILLTERQLEYPVVPDARRRLEVETWAVDDVKVIRPSAGEVRQVAPLYAHRHGLGESGGAGLFWHGVRRPTGWRTDRGTEVFLSFADLSGRARTPEAEVASLSLTCFNGDLPSRLPFGVDERGDFELVPGGPVRRVRALIKPTPVLQPALGRSLLWRLVSALSLNHLSLVDGGEDALQELLRLHNVGDGTAGERQIQGLAAVRSAPAYARVAGEHGVAFARGRRVEVELDEEQFPGGGAYLFAGVLERFLALSASMNSFTQLVAHSRQRRRAVGEWPRGAGMADAGLSAARPRRTGQAGDGAGRDHLRAAARRAGRMAARPRPARAVAGDATGFEAFQLVAHARANAARPARRVGGATDPGDRGWCASPCRRRSPSRPARSPGSTSPDRRRRGRRAGAAGIDLLGLTGAAGAAAARLHAARRRSGAGARHGVRRLPRPVPPPRAVALLPRLGATQGRGRPRGRARRVAARPPARRGRARDVAAARAPARVRRRARLLRRAVRVADAAGRRARAAGRRLLRRAHPGRAVRRRVAARGRRRTVRARPRRGAVGAGRRRGGRRGVGPAGARAAPPRAAHARPVRRVPPRRRRARAAPGARPPVRRRRDRRRRQLVLARDDVSPCVLGSADGARGARPPAFGPSGAAPPALGRGTWLASRPPARDPDETTLALC